MSRALVLLALAGIALFVLGAATGAAAEVRCGDTIAADALTARS